MKKIIIVLSVFFYIFTVPVFASEDDILKEPIIEEYLEEEEELKEDQNLLKGIGNINNTKSVVTDPLIVKRIRFSLIDGSEISANLDVQNINIGTKYKVVVNTNTDTSWRNYIGAVGFPAIGYFVRGYEEPNTEINWYKDNDIFSGKLYNLQDIGTTSTTLTYEIVIVEPTPEPTPEPTLEPEEPEVDPETISGNEILRELLLTNREINENVQGIYKLLSNNSVSDCILSNNSVSDNIIFKRLEDYSTSESLTLIGLVLAFGALVIYLIHKTVFKIRR